jgi:hypothetical protein
MWHRDHRIAGTVVADAVFLALRNNLDVKTAFLDRVTQRFSLKVVFLAL